MAYGGNIAFLQMIIGYVIARILLAIVLVPHYFKGEIYSPYQLFANTFGPSARQTAGDFLPEGLTLDEYEQAILREALRRADGNKSQAARLLGLTRNALRYRLSQMGMDKESPGGE